MCCWHLTFFLPCIPPSCHSSLHPFHPSSAQSLCKEGIPLVLPGPLGRNVVQQSGERGLFGYQTSSSNLRGVNLNIAVSCRLPRSLGRVREREKRKKGPWNIRLMLPKVFYFLFSGGTWQYCCQRQPLNSRLVGRENRTLSKLAHVRVLPYCLQKSSFSRFTRHVWGPFLEPRVGSSSRISHAWIYLLQVHHK